MSILSSLWGKKSPPISPIAISYVGLQHYFQLFQRGCYDIHQNPQRTHDSVRHFGNILKACNLPEQEHFLGDATAFEEVGAHTNGFGATSAYGLYTAHGHDNKGSRDFLFISIIESQPCPTTQKQMLLPRFVFLGQILPHEEGTAVHPLVMGSQSSLDAHENIDFTLADCNNPEDVTTHLAFADFPHRFALAGIDYPAQEVAREFMGMSPEVRFQKFDFLSRLRDPALFQAELQELVEQFTFSPPTLPTAGMTP